MKSYALSFTSSVRTVAPGHADSLAHPSVSSPACSPTAYALLSRYPHNQALSLLHCRKLHSPCTTKIPILQFLQHRQHRGMHTAAGFICVEDAQAVSLSHSNSLPENNPGLGGHSDTQSTTARPLLWGMWSGCDTKSTTQKGEFWTVQAGFKENHARMHSKLLGFQLRLKQTVPDSST